MKKRILSIIMVLSMCLSMLPTAAFAAEDTGLCKHHSEHTEECGYAKAVAGADCTHEHAAECYTGGILPEDAACTHTHDEDCYVTDCVHAHDGECGHTEAVPCGHAHDADCGYAPAVEETPCGHTEHTDCGYAEAADCTHTHDNACGYAEAVEGQPCGNTETDPACDHCGDCGYIAPVAEVPCGHTHDEFCGYAEAVDCTHAHDDNCGYVAPVDGTPCGHTEHTDCGYIEGAPCNHVCTEDTGCVTLSCAHVCGEDCTTAGELACIHVHDSECSYVEAVEASPCTYECALCALTEITAWSWIDEWEIIDPDTGIVVLPGASEDTPAYFDDIVSMLPVEITATVEGGEEIVALDGWACPGYPEEGAYSGNYIFTAALPEGYVLGLGTPELAVTVKLGGAALFAADVTKFGLTVSGGTQGTDFAYDREFQLTTGKKYTISSEHEPRVLTILRDTQLTISGEGADYMELLYKHNLADDYGVVVYIPSGVTANLTLNAATIHGGGFTAPITVEGKLNLTLVGANTLEPYFSDIPGIWVLEGGELTINGSGSLSIATRGYAAAIGQGAFAASDRFGENYNGILGTNDVGAITIKGGTLNLTTESEAAAIGSVGGSGHFTSITIEDGVINAKSPEGAAIGAGFSNSPRPRSGNVVIKGGTVNATGGQIMLQNEIFPADGIGSSYQALDGGVTITGGSVNTNQVVNNRPKADDDSELYMATVTLDGVSGGTAISSVTYYVDGVTGAQSYPVNGQTDASGSLYLWLPAGAIVTKADNYYGALIVTADDAAAAEFITGTTAALSLLDSYDNATVSFPTGGNSITAAVGSTVFVEVTATDPNVVDGVGTAENPTTYTHISDDLYAVTVPAGDGSVYVSTVGSTVSEDLVLDLAKGPIIFGYNSTDLRYVTYTDDNGQQKATKVPASIKYTVTQSNAADATANTITVSDWSQPLLLTIQGLNISSDQDVSLIDIDNSKVELTLSGENTLTSTMNSGAAKAVLGVDGTSTLTITEASNGGKLTVTAGTNNYGAAIGGDGNGNASNDQYLMLCGTINIRGSEVTATTQGYGAAIGSGYQGSGGAVNIGGGSVTATTQNYGAAIGSGRLYTFGTTISDIGDLTPCEVTISGGTVKATGYGGAGIGSGAGNKAEVTITGGTVTANTTYVGAAIGGGSHNTNSSDPSSAVVTITGGDITATGNTETGKTVAIGSGGYNSYSGIANSSEVTITGGNININANAAAIGGYSSSQAAIVTITGGSVNGSSNYNAPVNSSSTAVYKATADLSDTMGTGAAVTDAVITSYANGAYYDYPYGWNDVKTSDDGTVYLWLPNASEKTTATFGGDHYAGQVKDNNSGTLARAAMAPTLEVLTEYTADKTAVLQVTGADPGAKVYYVAYDTTGSWPIQDAIIAANQTVTADSAGEAVILLEGLQPNTKYRCRVVSEVQKTTADGSTEKYTCDYVESGDVITTKAIPALADLSFTIPTDHVYNGSQQGIGAVTGPSGIGSISITYAGEITVPSDAGTYTVVASIGEGTSYSAATIKLGQYTIAPKSLTITAKPQTISYGGSIQTGIDQVTVEGLVDSDALTGITISTTDTAVTSSGIITPSNASISGNLNNYKPTYQAGTLIIEKANLVLSGTLSATAIGYGQKLADSTITGTVYSSVGGTTGIAGAWIWKDGNSIQPTATASQTAVFTPTESGNYNALEKTVEVAVNAVQPTLTITAEPAVQVAGQPVTVTVTVKNPYDATFIDGLPTPTVSYKIGNGTATGLDLTNNVGSFSIPTGTAKDTKITVTVTTTEVADKYTAHTTGVSAEVTVTDKYVRNDQVTISGVRELIYGELPSVTGGFTGTKDNNDSLTVTYSTDGTTFKALDELLTDGKLPVGIYTVKVSYVDDTQIGAKTDTFAVVQATPTYSIPTGLTAIQGDTLSEVTLPSGWTWVTPSNSVGSGGTQSHQATFTPADTTNYKTVTVAVSVVVTPTYTVTFQSNGGTSVDPQTIVSGEKVAEPTGFTWADSAVADHHEFHGWYKDTVFTTEWNFTTDTVTADITLYAKWEELYDVGGEVHKYDDVGNEVAAANVTVELRQGSQVLKSATTDAEGKYSFTALHVGDYNIVAMEISSGGEQGRTMTQLVSLTNNAIAPTIKLPKENVSSELDIPADAGEVASKIVVGGLDDEAVANAEGSGAHVSVSMEIKQYNDITSTTPSTEEERKIVQEQTDIKTKAGDQALTFLKIVLEKIVSAVNGGEDKTTDITITKDLLQFIVPFDFPEGAHSHRVYRHHDGKVDILTTTANSAGEKIVLGTDTNGNSRIIIYAKHFSTYAIAYSEQGASAPQEPQQPQVPTGGGGGGGGISTYAITVEDADNGTVKSDRTRASYGSTVTITVTPDEGYKLGGLTVKDASSKEIEVTDKGNGKYTFTMPSVKVTVEASFVSETADAPCDGGEGCPSAKFIDIDPNAWYHEAIDYAIEQSLMNGYGNGYFGPGDNLSRGMLAQILYNLEGRPAVSGEMPFTDVADGKYYVDAIKWAQQNGIVGGYGNGSFGPNDPITREQLVTIMWRYAQYKGVDVSVGENTNILSYSDVSAVSEYAIPAMQWAVGAGVVSGTTTTTLSPQDKANRAQIATIFQRYCEDVVK